MATIVEPVYQFNRSGGMFLLLMVFSLAIITGGLEFPLIWRLRNHRFFICQFSLFS